MANRIGDLTGKQFGFWTVLRFSHKVKKHKFWLCRCQCNTEKPVYQHYLIHGVSMSCGCQKGAMISRVKRTHGLSKTREYQIWKGIIKRCFNTKHRAFNRYGGRGVTVCERWRHSFENFLADMGTAPSDAHSVDRFPNKAGHYEPGNARWATSEQQARNKTNNLRLTHDGIELTLIEWSERLGISINAIQSRLRLNWSVHDALTIPIGGRHYNSQNRLLTYRGRTLSMTDWAKELGFSKSTIESRLRYGWTAERTLSTPILIQRRRCKPLP